MPQISKIDGTVRSVTSGGNADGPLAFKSIPFASNDLTNISLLLGMPMLKGNVVGNS